MFRTALAATLALVMLPLLGTHSHSQSKFGWSNITILPTADSRGYSSHLPTASSPAVGCHWVFVVTRSEDVSVYRDSCTGQKASVPMGTPPPRSY